MEKTAVIAIGGNSILLPGDEPTVKNQWKACEKTCIEIAKVIQKGYNVVITHGNGPQVGNILLRAETCAKDGILPRLPLDVCGADSEGAMGYMIEQLLQNRLHKLGIEKQPVTLVTRVEVSKEDPAFEDPTKPIGPFYSKEEAEKLKNIDKWDMVEDAGRGYRRVVPSPKPTNILEIDAIKSLIQNGFIVIAVGGGGIPVVKYEEPYNYYGVAAVIDKDFASSLLAQKLNADLFIITTAVEKCSLNFNTPEQVDIDSMNIETAKKYINEGHFAKGSMLPKIEATISFIEKTNNEAIITSPKCLEAAIEHKAGTCVTK